MYHFNSYVYSNLHKNFGIGFLFFIDKLMFLFIKTFFYFIKTFLLRPLSIFCFFYGPATGLCIVHILMLVSFKTRSFVAEQQNVETHFETLSCLSKQSCLRYQTKKCCALYVNKISLPPREGEARFQCSICQNSILSSVTIHPARFHGREEPRC